MQQLEIPQYDYSTIPVQMRQYAQFVMWRKFPPRGDSTKPSKVYVDPVTLEKKLKGTQMDSIFVNWDQAVHIYNQQIQAGDKNIGIGFYFTEQDPFAFIDLDECGTVGNFSTDATNIMADIPSWSEFSVGGNGIHIIAEADTATITAKGYELYGYKHFIALTGRHVPTTPTEIVNCQPGVQRYHDFIQVQGGHDRKAGTAAPPDPETEAVLRSGLVTEDKGDRLEMDCPFSYNHTDPGNTQGAVYLKANYNGRPGANFSCLHASCSGKNIGDLRQVMQAHDEQYRLQSSMGAGIVQVQGDYFVGADAGLQNNLAPPDWLIYGFLERGQVGALFGESGSGKSFIVLDMCCRLALGLDYHGVTTHGTGMVGLVSPESGNATWRRIEAWRQHYNHHNNTTYTKEDFHRLKVATTPMDLMNPDHVAGVVSGFQGVDMEIIVMDTLAANNMTGDENKVGDMSLVLSHCGFIVRELLCGLMLVHHVGVDPRSKDRMRGSSALLGGLDYTLKVEKDPKRPLSRLIPGKVKDGAPLAPFVFDMVVQEIIGTPDVKGINATSLVPVLSVEQFDSDTGYDITEVELKKSKPQCVLRDVWIAAWDMADDNTRSAGFSEDMLKPVWCEAWAAHQVELGNMMKTRTISQKWPGVFLGLVNKGGYFDVIKTVEGVPFFVPGIKLGLVRSDPINGEPVEDLPDFLK